MTGLGHTSTTTDEQSPGAVVITGLAHSGKTEVRRALERLPELVMFRKSPPGRWSRAVVRQSAEEARSRGASRWGVQLSGGETRAASFLDLDPSARVVHLVREPGARAAASGAKAGSFRWGWETAKWVVSTRRALTAAGSHPDHYRIVRCESFSDDPRTAVGEVCAFAGLASQDLDMLVDDLPWERLRSEHGFSVGRAALRLRAQIGYEDTVDARPALGGRWYEILGHAMGRVVTTIRGAAS